MLASQEWTFLNVFTVSVAIIHYINSHFERTGFWDIIGSKGRIFQKLTR